MYYGFSQNCFKIAIQKIAEAIGDLIVYKIPNEITRTALQNATETASHTDENTIELPIERYMLPDKRQD